MTQWPLTSTPELERSGGSSEGVDASQHDDTMLLMFEKLRDANQRVDELELTVAQRERVIRELRRRLYELEGPFWERRTRLDDELDGARQRITRLEEELIARRDPPVGELTHVAHLERELAAIRATRTFRYTASARAIYSRMLRLRHPD